MQNIFDNSLRDNALNADDSRRNFQFDLSDLPSHIIQELDGRGKGDDALIIPPPHCFINQCIDEVTDYVQSTLNKFINFDDDEEGGGGVGNRPSPIIDGIHMFFSF